MTAATTAAAPALEPAAAVDDGVPAAPSGYRPHLDGVRFIAVDLVVAFHAGADRFRSIAAKDPDVWTLDMDKLVCSYLPICDPIVNGMVVKFDEGHLTATFARSLDTPIEKFLVDNRILP